ncbi:MAG: PRC-barrel domain-containing protein [Nanoarchaeota archaeon]
MMNQKSISGKAIEKTITSEEILGKDVIDIDGSNIGVVEKVLIDPKSLDFVGISIDKGFLKRGLTLGENYIDQVTDHAVLLKIRVAYEVKGKNVFDKDGKIIGIVTSIDLEGEKNIISSINVKSGFLTVGKELSIPAGYIKAIGEGVMLTIKKEEIKKE